MALEAALKRRPRDLSCSFKSGPYSLNFILLFHSFPTINFYNDQDPTGLTSVLDSESAISLMDGKPCQEQAGTSGMDSVQAEQWEVLTRLWDYTDSLLTQNTMPSLQSSPISLWKHLHLNCFAAASPSNLHLSKMCLVLALLLLFFLGGYQGRELPIFWGRHGGGDHSRGSGAKRQFTTQSSPTSQKKQRRA